MEEAKGTGWAVRWRKCGLIYRPTGELWWARSYATFPTVEIIEGSLVRVYFTSLDENRYGRIGYIEFDVNYPEKILFETKEPILGLGELGEFDDSGVNPFALVRRSSEKYLYYQGWQRCERVPYMLFTGLAIAKDADGCFIKAGRVPVLDRTDDEPFIRAAPYVLFDDGIFKMWYASGVRWIKAESQLHYEVAIRYATSADGKVWEADKHVCIGPKLPDEYGVGRPCVVRDQSLYRMWYSKRSFSELYAMGYAESEDGVHWTRKDDQAGLEKSNDGWDSEMVCYPYVVDIDSRRYMFYNGNRHGSTGFGCAVLDR